MPALQIDAALRTQLPHNTPRFGPAWLFTLGAPHPVWIQPIPRREHLLRVWVHTALTHLRSSLSKRTARDEKTMTKKCHLRSMVIKPVQECAHLSAHLTGVRDA